MCLFAAGQVSRVRNTQNAHIVCDLLQLAGARADTGRALVVVLREDKLHVGAPGFERTRRIGADDHAFAHDIVARGNQLAFALYLNTADAAGGNLVQLLQIAQAWDFDIDRSSGIQNGGALGYGYRNRIDRQIYHLEERPPLKIP